MSSISSKGDLDQSAPMNAFASELFSKARVGSSIQHSTSEADIDTGIFDRLRIDGATSVKFDLKASTTRLAGLMNAAAVSEAEYKRLLASRESLLRKSFVEDLTQSEKSRLGYIEWTLDRIEEGRQGESLDRLEAALSKYEKLGEELTKLRNRFDESSSRTYSRIRR